MNDTKKTLSLNRKRAILFGVCAGYGDYLNIEPFFVRLAFIIAVFTLFPPIIIGFYIISYFCMNRDGNSIREVKHSIANSRVCRHFKDVDYRKGLYKNTKNRRIFGVCSGFADYLETSPFFIRLAFLGSLFFGPFAIFAYIASAILMEKNPAEEATSREDTRYGHRPYFHRRANRPMQEAMKEEFNKVDERLKERRQKHHAQADTDFGAKPFNKKDIDECTNRFSELEMKLRRLEATITSKKFKLHSELKRMSDGAAS